MKPSRSPIDTPRLVRASSPFHLFSAPQPLAQPNRRCCIPRTFSHPAHYWRSFGDNARAHGASCMGLARFRPCAHRRWRGDCSYQSSAPALAAWVPLQGPRRPFPLCLSKARLPLRSCCQSELFAPGLFPCTSFLFSSARLIYIVVPSL